MRAPDSILDALETRIAVSLREDATAIARTEATARVLLALGPTDGLTMRDVAQRIDRDPSTVTRFVARTVREGLIEARPGTDDRRTRRLHLTPRGKEVRADLLERRLRRTRALVESVRSQTGLGADEVDWFLTVLLEGLSPAVSVARGA